MLADAFQDLRGTVLVDEDGNEEPLVLLPPATAAEVATLESMLPSPLPAEIRSALRVSKGLANGPLESLSLVDLLDAFGMDDLFPHPWPIAHDGFGNFWILDVRAGEETWGPIFFACHDPPVVAFQSDTLEDFVRAAVDLWREGATSPVDQVHEEVTDRIWREGSGLISRDVAAGSSDAVLREAATPLPADAVLADLRAPKLGDGFPWGRYGPRAEWTRHGRERLWWIVPPPKRSLFDRLFGRAGR